MTPPGETLYDDYEEPEELFEGVYLGCKMSREARDEVLRLVRSNLPMAKVYQARKRLSRVELSFDQVF